MTLSKRLHIKRDMTLAIDLQKHPRSNIPITVPAGRQLNLIWLGNGLKKAVSPSIKFKLHEKARLHLALAVTRSNVVTVATSIELVGDGAEAYVSGIFHGFRDDCHTLDVTMHHHAKNTKGDILIKGIYENTAYGKFSGLLKISPGATRTNSYFGNNTLLLDHGRATSIPTLEILANDVRATHGSTTSRVNAEQLFYLESRGLSRRQAMQSIIQGFFHPVRDRLPENAKKILPNKF